MSDTKVLSKEEVDALLNLAQTTKSDQNCIVATGDEEKWSELNSSLCQRSLDNIVELTSAECERVLTSFFRKKLQVKSIPITKGNLSECLKDKMDKCVYCVFHMESHDCYGMMTVDLVFLDQIINFIYGGHPSKEELNMSTPGKVGLIIAEKICQLILNSFTQATKEYGTVNCQIIKMITQPNLTSKMTMDDSVHSIELHLTVSDVESKITILPSEKFVKEFFPAQDLSKHPVESNFWRTAIETQVADTFLSLNVTLPDTNLKLSELMKMKRGDLLPIGDPTLVYVCLNNLKLFRASAAQANSKRVIKILSEI